MKSMPGCAVFILAILPLTHFSFRAQAQSLPPSFTTHLTPPIVWSGVNTNASTGSVINFVAPTSNAPEAFFRVWAC